MSDTVLQRLLASLDEASAAFDGSVGVAPVAVLWTDEDREWEAVVPLLQQHRRVLKVAGYRPESAEGPAYWVRCAVEHTLDVELPEGLPIVYLPGVARDRLRALDEAPKDVAPLGALIYRSLWFCHRNGKDWTVRAWLANPETGLGLNVASDAATNQAIEAALGDLVQLPVSRLEGKYVDAHFLHALVNPDPVRSLLEWIDDPQRVRAAATDATWNAFAEQCRTEFGFDPAKGELEAARRLGEAVGPWAQVWSRFREAPQEYPNLPDRLLQAQPGEMLPANPGAWPGIAERDEDSLRAALVELGPFAPGAARDRIAELEAKHKIRRGYVWAQLGKTPLVLALEFLAELATVTSGGAPTGNVAEIADWYAAGGWKADAAVLRALNEVDRNADLDAVAAAITPLYRPWLDAAAKAMQEAVGPMANADTYFASSPPEVEDGTVVLFVDGLRLDVAHLLAARLNDAAVGVELGASFAGLPTVTQTAKPAIVPIDQSLLAAGNELAACRAPDGPSAGVNVLRKLLTDSGVQVLKGSETGDPAGRAWTETGELDHRGHDAGLRLAHEVEHEVETIAARIRSLLHAGWSTVSVVTDHGWLLVPGGLPKNEALPVSVTETKKGRCARLKDGTPVDVPTVPWHWNLHVRIAVAPGISCFEAGKEYEHGGVSPQECVVPRMTVRAKQRTDSRAVITSEKWRGLALTVEFSDLPEQAKVDLRTIAGDPSTSIADRARMTAGTGRVVLLVRDDDDDGRVAQLVVTVDDVIVLQRETIVGQNR